MGEAVYAAALSAAQRCQVEPQGCDLGALIAKTIPYADNSGIASNSGGCTEPFQTHRRHILPRAELPRVAFDRRLQELGAQGVIQRI
jgi:hypothetical protein